MVSALRTFSKTAVTFLLLTNLSAPWQTPWGLWTSLLCCPSCLDSRRILPTFWIRPSVFSENLFVFSQTEGQPNWEYHYHSIYAHLGTIETVTHSDLIYFCIQWIVNSTSLISNHFELSELFVHLFVDFGSWTLVDKMSEAWEIWMA